jgi:membrane-bound lytic murein transglycosylase D
MRYLVIVCLLIQSFFSFAQLPNKKAPDFMEFGGMTLELSEGVKKKIDADIKMIYSSVKYLQQKIDRANLYFPIIERVFEEQGFPEDFKYLALQESSLVSDAVSSSNAVGYWQFKKESAIEVNVSVNTQVDERMHIVYASRGAAKYLTKNNVALQNWIYALLSYNLGAGGVKPHVKTKYVNAKKMLIDEAMHWYVIRFLAHKLAYEDLVGKNLHPELALLEYNGIKNKSLDEISKQAVVAPTLVRDYNKWCLKAHVPSDKEYIVLIPTEHQRKEEVLAKNKSIEDPITHIPAKEVKPIPRPSKIPDIQTVQDQTQAPIFVKINGVIAIQARNEDNLNQLIIKSGIPKEAFLYFNDMKGFEEVKTGQFYYLQLKKSKANVAFHTVQWNESMWSIAQKYAMKVSAIRTKNRMTKNELLKPGRVLWLRSKRPQGQAVEYKTLSPKPEPTPVVIKKENPQETLLIKENPIPSNAPLALYHVVKAGETVFSISRMYHVDSDSIKEWNQLSDYSIKVDQKLKVGYAEQIKGDTTSISPTSKSIEYIVKPGDTLYSIARLYGVKPDQIMQWNQLASYTISIGQRLVIIQ